MQHGHPQMTVADLLGSPLPRDLVEAENARRTSSIAWRSWLGMRVKIIDEYNRIPTRTQSALLTVLADDYAEIFDQIYEMARSAWYLTANDDAGGGTYQVIEALRDRIDVVVQALPFNTRFSRRSCSRAERSVRPEEVVPDQIVFTEAELDRLHREVLAVPIPRPVLRRLEFFAGQFEYLERGRQPVRVQDQGHGAARRRRPAPRAAGGHRSRPPERPRHPDDRTGLSVRALQTLVLYAKAMALLPRQARGRGSRTCAQVLPFVLLEKLPMDTEARFFEPDEHGGAAPRPGRRGCARCSTRRAASTTAEGLDRDDPVGDALARVRPRARRARRRRGARPGSTARRAAARRHRGAAQALRPPLRRRADAQVPPPALHELPRLAALVVMTRAVAAAGPSSPSGPVESAGEPAPLWAAALRRVADELGRDLDVARAGGASDAALGEALRAAGPGFERFVARQGGAASGLASSGEGQPVLDRWADALGPVRRGAGRRRPLRRRHDRSVGARVGGARDAARPAHGDAARRRRPPVGGGPGLGTRRCDGVGPGHRRGPRRRGRPPSRSPTTGCASWGRCRRGGPGTCGCGRRRGPSCRRCPSP